MDINSFILFGSFKNSLCLDDVFLPGTNSKFSKNLIGIPSLNLYIPLVVISFGFFAAISASSSMSERDGYLLVDLGKYWNFEHDDAFTITDNIPFHEAGLLKLNCDKALSRLKWKANLEYEDTIKFTSEWYYDFYNSDKDILDKTISQIYGYEYMAKEK